MKSRESFASVRRFVPAAFTVLTACFTHPARAQSTPDSAAVIAVVERFHAALRAGDSVTVVAQLAPDVVVLESGDIETRAAYLAHHLPADIEFAKAVTSQRDPALVQIRGDVAWTSSTAKTRGTFRGREVNSVGAELMVLTRTPDGWKISAIHWSSHRATP
jgi:ketosteroid isomerase-like protein